MIRLIRTRTGIGHGQEEWLLMLQGKGLVLEFVAVDGLAAGAIASSKVTTLTVLEEVDSSFQMVT